MSCLKRDMNLPATRIISQSLGLTNTAIRLPPKDGVN